MLPCRGEAPTVFNTISGWPLAFRVPSHVLSGLKALCGTDPTVTVSKFRTFWLANIINDIRILRESLFSWPLVSNFGLIGASFDRAATALSHNTAVGIEKAHRTG